MATHSSILAWRIPWTEEPGGQSMGSQTTEQLSFIHFPRAAGKVRGSGFSLFLLVCFSSADKMTPQFVFVNLNRDVSAN